MQKAFEKIVERLEEYREDFMSDIYAELNEDSDNNRANRIIERFDSVFEIVNQVAEEYKSTEHISCSTEEVCEWVEKSVDSIKLVREPHRLRLFHIEEERQFCPYCGKKIKVVK